MGAVDLNVSRDITQQPSEKLRPDLTVSPQINSTLLIITLIVSVASIVPLIFAAKKESVQTPGSTDDADFLLTIQNSCNS
jgi:hypothetical protein